MMKLLNELLSLSETTKGTTLVGLTINNKLITDKTKDEVWTGPFVITSNPRIKSLEGAPTEVIGNFTCRNNAELTSLKGGPDKITGSFHCYDIPMLKSLIGAPKEIIGGFYCSYNPNLESLEGAPKTVTGNFGFEGNPKITSLKNIHKQITHLGGKFIAPDAPIKSNVLGLLLNGCTEVTLDNKEVEEILNRYLPNTRGNKAVIECQSELLDADLEDFAEL